MGAIVLANYCARSGSSVNLDYAIGIGGGLDMRWNLLFARSRWLWQPLLSRTLIDSLISRYVPNHLKDAVDKGQITAQNLARTLAATDVTTIDQEMITPYNGFTSVVHYYESMSAVDHVPQLAIPLAMVGSLDDPIITEKTMGKPQQVADSNAAGNMFILLTQKGGHVGYPLGNVVSAKWLWMSTIVETFVESARKADEEKEGDGEGEEGGE